MLAYTLKEGLAGFRRAKFAVFTATSAMAVALVLIGVFLLLGYQGAQVRAWLQQRVGEVEIFLEEETEERMRAALVERARFTLGVEEATYISLDEAQTRFREAFGTEAERFMEGPFLQASIQVRVEPEYANPDSMARLVSEFAAWNRVDDVVYNEDLLVKVQKNLTLLTFVGLVLGGLVIVASIFLVANTIRLTIYARRLLIRTMKLVGATDRFIRRPFLVEGIVQGVLAGLVAGGILWGLHVLIASMMEDVVPLDPAQTTLLVVLLVLIGLGLGWAGSLLAVRRFIKRVSLH